MQQAEELQVAVNPADPYEAIRLEQNESNDEIICDICLDDDDEEGDEIVICENCLVAVH